MIDNLKDLGMLKAPLVKNKALAKSKKSNKTRDVQQLWKKTVQRVLHESDEEEDSTLVQVIKNLAQLKKESSDDQGAGDFDSTRIMNNHEVEGVLWKEPIGTWIFFYNTNGDERLTVKKEGNKLKRFRIYRIGKGYSMSKSGNPVSLYSLINELQEKGIIGEQLDKKKLDDEDNKSDDENVDGDDNNGQ